MSCRSPRHRHTVRARGASTTGSEQRRVVLRVNASSVGWLHCGGLLVSKTASHARRLCVSSAHHQERALFFGPGGFGPGGFGARARARKCASTLRCNAPCVTVTLYPPSSTDSSRPWHDSMRHASARKSCVSS
mmetsp:Transcript_14785/g.44171  ORF Transcript_14785/g.44171 Transcript_14785/m.44171 type:complete len:133 (-) Transcript_14785:733-1131(-)